MSDLIWVVFIQVMIWCSSVWLLIGFARYLKKNGRKHEKKIGLAGSIFLCGIVFFMVLGLLNGFSHLFFKVWAMPSDSMENTILKGDYCVSNQSYYGWSLFGRTRRYFEFHKLRRGDVLVFLEPRDHEVPYMKRCVGIPGDAVEVQGRTVIVNGKKTVEPYAHFTDPADIPEGEAINGEKDDYGPVTLGEGQMFVLGDNRSSGLDSRNWGPIDERLVLGKISVIYWRGRDKRILLKEVR